MPLDFRIVNGTIVGSIDPVPGFALKNRFARDEWNLGIVHQTVEDITRHGFQKPVMWFPPNSWRIFADPFCVHLPNGTIVILAEMLNHWIGKGSVVGAVIKPGDDPLNASFCPIMAAPAHLSYPFVVQEGPEQFLLTESYQAGGLYIWRRNETGWKYEKTLLTRGAIDPTLYRDHSLWWLFCTFVDDRPDERLHLFYAESLLGEWTPHRANPVKQDRANARPGGALFEVDGKLIRPAQDSSRTYGGSLVLNQVLTLTPDAFVETPYRILQPPSEWYADGIHTIAAAGEYTVIDGKRWHRGPGSLACWITAGLLKRARRSRGADFIDGTQFWSLPTR